MSQSVIAIKGIRQSTASDSGTEYTCIPVAGSYTTDSNGKIKINSNAKSRYILSCYALWETNHCEVTSARMGSLGSYLFYFYALGGVTVCKTTSSWVSGEPQTPYTALELEPYAVTAYTSELKATTGGTVSFYVGKKTLNVQEWWTYPRTETASFTAEYGGKTVSQSDFNNSGALHLGGEVVTFKATPNTNYGVKNWTIAYSGKTETKTGSTISVTLPKADVVVTCNFQKTQGKVTVKSEDTNVLTITNPKSNATVSTGTTITSTATIVEDKTHAFKGWFKNNSTTAHITSAKLSVTFDGNDVTYTAKARSRSTTVSVSATNGGKFDATIEGDKYSSQTRLSQASYDGQPVSLKALTNDYTVVFKNWSLPDGTTSTNATVSSFTLLQSATNTFVANYTKKTKRTLNIKFTGIGNLSYSHANNLGSGTIEEDGTIALYDATDVVITASAPNNLYKFSSIQYKGEALSPSNKPTWVKSFSDNTVEINIPLGENPSDLALDIVYDKKPTYVIPDITISGHHRYRETCAANEGCLVSIKNLPDPAEIVGDKKKYFKGEKISFAVQSGAKWNLDNITVVYDEDETEQSVFTNGDASFVLERDIYSITATFVPKTYKVYTSLGDYCEDVGYLTVDGEDEADGNIKIIEGEKYINVLVDTSISVTATPKIDDVNFHSWEYNNGLFYNATQTFKIQSESRIVARFSSKHTFGVVRESSETDTVLGTVSVQYEGDSGSETEVLQGTTPFEVMLLCGTTYSLSAEKSTDESYFGGWFDAANNRIADWGNEISGVVASVPRDIRAKYVKEELWPILRLRKTSDTDAVEFNVRGARTEREQELGDDRTIKLRDNVQDYFFNPYEIAVVELSIANGAELFMGWMRYKFGSVETDGTEPISSDFYSTEQNLLVLMSEDIFLKPTFYSDDPISVNLSYTEGSNNAMGALYLDGEPIDQIGQSIATFKQGDKVDLVAMPNNEYRFVGWFSNAKGEGQMVTNSARYTITVQDPDGYTYYAKFEEDVNSIFTFDSGSDAKRMTWHSKRVVVNTPVNFSVAQVDAEGYGQEGPKLKVLKASSPDVPAKGKTYTMKDGNSRRLAVDGRGEKCFEFVVESSVPVNRVAISTSVTGLMGGA